MKVRINGQPNTAQRKALKQECAKEFDKLLELYNKQVALQVLHILRFDFGFGQQRLKQFTDKLTEMQLKTIDKYDAIGGDVPYICEIKLKESGINLDELLKEG